MVERPKRSGTRNRRSSIGDTFGQANAGWKHRADGQSNVNRLNSGPPPKAGGARLKRDSACGVKPKRKVSKKRCVAITRLLECMLSLFAGAAGLL